MKAQRPGILAVRAVNQYRRREVLTYLGLRYYLANSAAARDNWVRDVAVQLTQYRKTSAYLWAPHFKGLSDDHSVECRQMHLPGPNEALAEAALLDECAKFEEMRPPHCVFSYRFPPKKSKCGIFDFYMNGLRERHEQIALACEFDHARRVMYLDIQRFYPSISHDLGLKSWRKWSEKAGLPSRFRELGEKLLDEHRSACSSGEGGLLTGPMFSHLIANLVLRDLDDQFDSQLPAKYFRYVDDITLVGSQEQITKSLATIGGRLEEVGLQLHDANSPKTLELSAEQWLEGKYDFSPSHSSVSWMTLIGGLKQWMVSKPDEVHELRFALRNEGFRIPIKDYSHAIVESPYVKRFLELAREKWFRWKVDNTSAESVIDETKELLKKLKADLTRFLDGAADSSGFDRRRRIPKLRYCAGRLAYLAEEKELLEFSDALSELPELTFHSEVMRAVATRNVDNVLQMGTNAVQAVAQPLRAAQESAVTTRLMVDENEALGLAVLNLNGVSVKQAAGNDQSLSEIEKFALKGPDLNMMQYAPPFLRELACLHGLSPAPRHPGVLESAFDVDEEQALDAIEQIQGSLSV